MIQRTKLDGDLVLTEISMQSASLAEGLRSVVLESSRKLARQYPDAGWSEDAIVSEFESQLERHGVILKGQQADGTDVENLGSPGDSGSLPDSAPG